MMPMGSDFVVRVKIFLDLIRIAYPFQTTASEATYYSLLAARTATFSKYDAAALHKYGEKAAINGQFST